jgi:hypothetical protein
MDAHRKAREYLEKHGVERWLRTAAEKLVVGQPENPFSVLYEALGREVRAREEEEQSKGKGGFRDRNGEDVGTKGGVSLVAQIAITGRDGNRQVISLDKVANEDMARGARGAITLRGWGRELGARVCEALVGHGSGSGILADGESGGVAKDSAGDLEDLVGGDGKGDGSSSSSSSSRKESWLLPEEMRVRLRELFGKIDMNENGVLDRDEREEMKEEMRMFLVEFGIGINVFQRLKAGVNCAEFEAWFVREWETASKMQALAGVDGDLLRAAAQSIPSGSPDFPLGGMAGMGPADIARECRERIAAAAEEALVKKQAEVREQADKIRARKEMGMEEEEGMANGKYAILGEGIRMAKFGSIEDFHTGIAGQIGLPNPNLMGGMEAEHCKRPDSEDEFQPGNYDTTTTPAQEWLVVTDEGEAKRVSIGKRCVQTLKELRENPLVQKAKLRDEELLALLLYTGLHFNLCVRPWMLFFVLFSSLFCILVNLYGMDGFTVCRLQKVDREQVAAAALIIIDPRHAARRSDVSQVQQHPEGIPRKRRRGAQGQHVHDDDLLHRERHHQALQGHGAARRSKGLPWAWRSGSPRCV